MKFVEQERVSGVQFVEDMAMTVKATFRRACEHDGIPADAAMVVFSEDNPIVPFYERACQQYDEAISNFAAHGYVGLVNGKTLYKRKKRR